jgi:hypothetical protein
MSGRLNVNVKDIWISESITDGLFNISIRFPNHTPQSRLALSQLELPPRDSTKTKQMSLTDAQALGLSEDHYRLGIFDDEDLIKLYDALRAYFRETGRLE